MVLYIKRNDVFSFKRNEGYSLLIVGGYWEVKSKLNVLMIFMSSLYFSMTFLCLPRKEVFLLI